MSVREIINGRFHGLRVQRNIDQKPVVENYSFRIPSKKIAGRPIEWRDATKEERAQILTKAERYDRQLKKQQEEKREQKGYDPFSATARNNTGIRGLNFRLRKEYNKLVEAFFVTVVDDKGKLHNRYHRISTLGWDGAWNIAVEEIAKIKHLSPVVLQRMRDKIPDQAAMKSKVKPR